MANRILRDWTCSESIDALSPAAEVLFTRLIMKADDYGCFHGNPKLIKAAVFPLREVKDSDVLKWIHECRDANVIKLYQSQGKQYIQIENFGQRLRAMSRKFPDPSDNTLSNDRSPLTDDSNPPLETKRSRNEVETETEDETETETKKKAANSFAFKKSLLDLPVSEKIATEWLLVRKNKKATNSETAFQTIVSEIIKTGATPEECITLAVVRSWSGFKAEWFNNEKRNSNGKTTTAGHAPRTADDKLQDAMRRVLGSDSFAPERAAGNEPFEDVSYRDA